MIYLINYQLLVIVVSFICWIFIMVQSWFPVFLTAKPSLHIIIYWYQSHIYARYLQLFMYFFRCSSLSSIYVRFSFCRFLSDTPNPKIPTFCKFDYFSLLLVGNSFCVLIPDLWYYFLAMYLPWIIIFCSISILMLLFDLILFFTSPKLTWLI